jgi:hypothetical protein
MQYCYVELDLFVLTVYVWRMSTKHSLMWYSAMQKRNEQVYFSCILKLIQYIDRQEY